MPAFIRRTGDGSEETHLIADMRPEKPSREPSTQERSRWHMMDSMQEQVLSLQRLMPRGAAFWRQYTTPLKQILWPCLLDEETEPPHRGEAHTGAQQITCHRNTFPRTAMAPMRPPVVLGDLGLLKALLFHDVSAMEVSDECANPGVVRILPWGDSSKYTSFS